MILGIETSTSACSIALFNEESILGSTSLFLAKSHSSVLPIAIDQLLELSGVSRGQLSAIAVSKGPGSYTGLRIGSSSAKALAFALGIPLLSVDALETMIQQIPRSMLNDDDLLLPMIDARRMEVYTKGVDYHLVNKMEIQPVVIEADTFLEFKKNRLLMFGNGARKSFEVLNHKNKCLIEGIHPSAEGMFYQANKKLVEGDFENVAYFEPLYLKEFQAKKSKDLLRP
jgi:tRNA threonylcarbamoyladenosine biosynthesis protein TsaB